MNRAVFFALLAVAFCLPSSVLAQSGSSGALSTLSRAQSGFSVTNRINNRPTVSPYLRLLQGNGQAQSGFANVQPIYQTQVRPELERRQNARVQAAQIQGIQRDLSRLRQQYTQPNQGYMQTGHPTRFMSYSHYYPSLYGGR